MPGRVLLTNRIHPKAQARLEQEAEALFASATDTATLAREIADVDAILVRNPITDAVLQAGKRLKVVARHGVGLDYIPVATATKLGLPVTFTPDANTESVAEYVVGAMIALSHNFFPGDRAVQRHDWDRRNGLMGLDLRGRTCGIIGLGRIGTRVGEICRTAFRMRVLAHDPHLSDAAIRERGADPAPRDTVLAEAEFLTLHVPMDPTTANMIDRAAIARMRPGAYFINAARGGLVDSAALAEAVRSGHLAGAAVDVLEAEPPPADHPLIGIDNIMITPHSAALTDEAMINMGMGAVEDILRVLRGERPLNCANPEVLTTKK